MLSVQVGRVVATMWRSSWLRLKFFEVEARFPEGAGEVPAPAVAYIAQQVKVPAEE